MTKEEVAKYIDHTLLAPQAGIREIVLLCQEAKRYNFASVCVNPVYVSAAADELSGSDVKVCTVVGFPLGATTTKDKISESVNAIANGADEIDMVINIGAAKDGRFSEVGTDIQGVVDACKDAAKKAGRPVIVKTILETCLLDDNAIVNCCLCAKKAGADFVKTSTGFGTGGATKEDVALMAKAVAGKAQVKASGGIRDKAAFEQMIEAGATRVGCSAGVKIMEGYKNE